MQNARQRHHLCCLVGTSVQLPSRQLCTNSARQLHATGCFAQLTGIALFSRAAESIRRGSSCRVTPAVAGTTSAVAAEAADEAATGISEGNQQYPQHLFTLPKGLWTDGIDAMQSNSSVATQESSGDDDTAAACCTTDGCQPSSVAGAATREMFQQPLNFLASLPAQWLSVEALSALKQQQHATMSSTVHPPFLAFFAFLGLMATTATSADWTLDMTCFAAIWSVLWFMSCRLRASSKTVALVNLLPLLHLFGSQGAYHWEIGNLSWDILVHMTNGFLGTLLIAAVLDDVQRWQKTAGSAASYSAATAVLGCQSDTAGSATAAFASGQALPDDELDNAAAAAAPLTRIWRSMAVKLSAAAALLLVSTSMVEVVEAVGGNLAGHTGEGIFLRGAGDFCLVSAPCSEEVDSMKDMVDNVAGMTLGLIALATSSKSSSMTSSQH